MKIKLKNQEKFIFFKPSARRAGESLGFLIFLLALVFIFPSCKEKRVIEEEKLVLIYADIVIAQDTISSGTPQAAMASKEAVLSRYKVTSKQYEQAVRQINKHPEQWEDFFDKVIAHLETQRKKHKPGSGLR